MNKYYWNTKNWEFTTKQQENCIAISIPLLLTIAPLMGLLFVLFLPFIGFALTAMILINKFSKIIQNNIIGLVAVIYPSWQPGEAYLTGRRQNIKNKKLSTKNKELDSLINEVKIKRNKIK